MMRLDVETAGAGAREDRPFETVRDIFDVTVVLWVLGTQIGMISEFNRIDVGLFIFQ